MKPSTIAAIVFVIGSGIAGSYFILKNPLSSASTNTISSNSGENGTAQASGQIPINWISKIGDTIADIASSSLFDTASPGAEVQTSVPQNDGNATNLTEAVAQTIFSRMKTQDQSGNQPFQSFDPNNPNDQALLSEATQGLDPAELFFSDPYSYQDLKISGDNSKEAKARYFNGVSEITKSRFNDSKYERSSEQIIADINNDCLGGGASLNKELADVYKNLINDYSNLIVPSDWLLLHRQIIIHFKNSAEIYQALADCSNDPVRSYLAVQILSQLFDNAKSIQNSLAEKYKEADIDL